MQSCTTHNNHAAYISFMNWYRENYAYYGEYDGINACYFCGKLFAGMADFWVLDPDVVNQHWFNVCGEDCQEQYFNWYESERKKSLGL